MFVLLALAQEETRGFEWPDDLGSQIVILTIFAVMLGLQEPAFQFRQPGEQ